MKYFNTISEITMDRWVKCQSGDLTYTRLLLVDGTQEEDLIAWETLNYDYTLKFGIHRKQAHFLQLQKQLTIAKLDLIITGDRFIQNKIDDLELEIKTKFPPAENASELDLEKTLITLTKWIGQNIKLNEISVFRFFTMLEMFNKENEPTK